MTSQISRQANVERFFTPNKWAWLLWLLFIVLVAAKRGFDPADHSNVFWIYRGGAMHWLQAIPLYDGSGHGFIYLPQSAALFTPFALLPETLSGVLWRLVNTGTFAFGVFGLSRLAIHRHHQQLFLPVTIVAILMSVSAAKLGQMTLILTGMIMLAVVDLSAKSWWRAAGWIVASFAFKPVSIVMMLLVSVLYPRTIVPFIAFLGLLVLIPFVMQDPDYVWEQYRASVTMLQQVATKGESYADPFAQIFWMMRGFGVTTPESVQFVMRVSFAGLTLALCWWLRDRQHPHTFCIYLFTFSTCYLLLFNPRTENNTYAMIGPAIGIFTAWSFHGARSVWRYGYLGIITAYMLSYRTGKWLTGAPTMWMKPLLCIVFLMFVLAQLREEGSIESNEPER